ncbi:MUC4 [Branchiostoma lanceolatum]|uniref:MUC4 protein n=1 Tax=Branchiostoma lanceolatum TaxID=7740 RepID=A0A8S4MLB5_BRALA|nr:MUC4 [Branchiostoma lanceolatum]
MMATAKRAHWRRTDTAPWRNRRSNPHYPSPQQDPDRRWRTQDLPRRPKNQEPKKDKKICPICQQAGRQVFDHFLSACPYLPDEDKESCTRRHVGAPPQQESGRGVKASASPNLEAFHKGAAVKILLDSGAQSSMIRADEARRLGLFISPNNTDLTPIQADGRRISPIGECTTTFYRRKQPLHFNAIVVEDLADPIIAGITFLQVNSLIINFSKRTIHLPDGSIFDYSTSTTQAQPRIHSIWYSKNRMHHNLARSRREASCSSVQVQVPKVMHLLHTTPVVHVVTNPAVTEQQTNTRSLVHTLEHLSPAAKVDTLPVKEELLSLSADADTLPVKEKLLSSVAEANTQNVKKDHLSSPEKADTPQVQEEHLSPSAKADIPPVKEKYLSSVAEADTPHVTEEHLSPSEKAHTPQVQEEHLTSPADADTSHVKEEHLTSPADTDTLHVKEEHLTSPAEADTSHVKEGTLSSPAEADTPHVKEEHLTSPADTDTSLVKEEHLTSPADADTSHVKEKHLTSPAEADTSLVKEGTLSSLAEADTSHVKEEHLTSPAEADTPHVKEEHLTSPADADTSHVKEEHLTSAADADTSHVKEEHLTSPAEADTPRVKRHTKIVSPSAEADTPRDTQLVKEECQSPPDRLPPVPPDPLPPAPDTPAVRPPPEPPPSVQHPQNFMP